MIERLGVCCGTWDIDPLHPGHRNFLEVARSKCGTLVVFVNTDEVVARNKGRKPRHSQVVRQHIVRNSTLANEVVLFGGTDEEQRLQIANLKPEIYFLSEDGNPDFDEPLQQLLGILGTVFIVIPRLPDVSTSQLSPR